MPIFDEEDKLIRKLGRSRLMPAPVNRSNRWNRRLHALRDAQHRQLLMFGIFLMVAFAAALCNGQEGKLFRKSTLVQVEPSTNSRWKDNQHFRTAGESRQNAEPAESADAIRRRVSAIFASASKQQTQDSITQRFIGTQERANAIDPIQVFNQSAPGGPVIERDQNGTPFVRPQSRFRESGISGLGMGGQQATPERIQPAPFDLKNFPASQLPPESEPPETPQAAVESLPPAFSSSPKSENPVDANEAGATASSPERQVERREQVVENYDDGKPRLYRTMAMDADGNYYNDGPWRVVDRNGENLAEGKYRNGLMHGQWGRRHSSSEGGMFATKPFTFYQGPFDSIANFKDGKLHGSWVIYDNQQRSIFEISYKDGQRHGSAVWYFPNQKRMREATFNEGVLDGEVIERDADDRIVARDRYIDGRKVIRTTTRYRPNVKQSETFYLDVRLTPESMDNWWEAKPTPFVSSGSRVQNGPVRSWYPNRQPKFRGQYKSDRPIGQALWWHENGNRKTVGLYDAFGQRSGRWIWWHKNGIKQFEGSYKEGKPVGLWRSWFEDGRLRKERDYDQESDADGFESGYGGVDLSNPVADDADKEESGKDSAAMTASEGEQSEENGSQDASDGEASKEADPESQETKQGKLILPSETNEAESNKNESASESSEPEIRLSEPAESDPELSQPDPDPVGSPVQEVQEGEAESSNDAPVAEENVIPTSLSPAKSTPPVDEFEIKEIGLGE